jgi:SAM-dependent methyltransferase
VARDDYAEAVSTQYGRREFDAAILDTLRATGKNTETLTPDDLAPLTFFGREGKQGALALARLAGVRRGTEVLELGSGLGGAARVLASELGCRVTGLDLTAENCEAATRLTARVSLADRVTFQHGNALDMPFPDVSFDVVWSEQFAQHIADKERLYGQIYRVLRPGGRLAMREFMAGPVQPIHYPVPWARDASISFLRSGDALRALLANAGLREVAWEDLTATTLARLQDAASSDLAPRLPTAGELLHGAGLREMLETLARNYAENRVMIIQGVFERA